MTFSGRNQFLIDTEVYYSFLFGNALFVYLAMNDILLNFGMRNIAGFRFFDPGFTYEGSEALSLQSEIDNFEFRTGGYYLDLIFNNYEALFLVISAYLWYKYNEKTKSLANSSHK